MAMTNGRRQGVRAEINVTPMIDILLVVMIIFMVVAPLSPAGLDVLVPQPARSDEKQADATGGEIVISVQRGGALLINHEPCEPDDLQQRLARIFAFRADRVVFVRGDADLEFRDIARVIDLAKGAGIARVGLMTGTAKIGG